MPHGHSWFSLFSFHGHFQHYASQTLGKDGLTWLGHQPVDVQGLYGALFVLLLIAIISVITDTSIRDSKGDLLPAGTLTVRNFVEILVGTAYGMMSDIMGKKAARYFLPLIGTCAFFILFSNAMGLIPGFLPPTSVLNITLACGIIIFLATHVYGVKENGIAYFKHFLGPIWWMAPLMLPIELVSHFVRPISLGVRLMANMTADHMVLSIFIGLVPFIVPIPMYVLGTIVVAVQTLVFCLLSTVYIGMAIEHHEHAEH
jgi:F-type H+-transporting ATPase subunit a